MKILIDMQGIQGASQNRGIGRYTQQFVHALIAISKKHDIYLLLNGLYPDTARKIQQEFSSSLPRKSFLTFSAVGPVQESKQDNEINARISEILREKLIEDIAPDFLIITSLFEGMVNNSVTSIAAYSQNIPTAVIFYDLIPYIHDEVYLNTPQKSSWYMRKFNALKQADALLCISFSAQNEAVIYLDKKNSDMTVISSATDKTFYSVDDDPEILQHYGITKHYIMHASAYEERKNFEGLIEAFALLPASLRKKYQLVLVCVLTSKQKNNLLLAAKDAGLQEDEMVLTGYISDNDLVSIYTKATLFVFPSKHEGFGLPPLEAMACGTATIGSDLSSIPEVIGRSDALFDPLDVDSIAQKITEVLTNDDFLHSLEAHALLQAKKFSWELTAEKTLLFLEEKHRKNPARVKTISLNHSTDSLVETLSSRRLLKALSDTQLRNLAIAIEQNEKMVLSLILDGYYDMPLHWRIEGPFDSSYSLALLNRETALALHKLGYDVALHSTEGPGDFDPDPAFLTSHPTIEQLYKRSQTLPLKDTDITSRNLYPPRVCDMQAKINMLHHYAWEESVFPPEWVENFNHCLDGMTCLSSHVEKIMIDNGISIPLTVSGCGADHWERITSNKSYRINTKTFRFLHVSSCFPRKGADVMLKAYGDAFTSSDDVTLVIKTFPNPHNEIRNWLEEVKKDNPYYPDVLIIEKDLDESQLKALYEQCHVLVAPSRAEGFGLPMAEAMLSGLPVITTGWSGQLDFCTEETAWLVDYSFAPAKTHFNLYNSVWAEPSRAHLARTMKELSLLSAEERDKKVQKGRMLLLENYKWSDVAKRLADSARYFAQDTGSSKPRIGWISTWNTKCGIASYSKHLVDNISDSIDILAAYTEDFSSKDESNVYRCWQPGDEDDLTELLQTIKKQKLNTIVIQFNYGFFHFDHFNHFLDELNKSGKNVILMMHATTDPVVQAPHKKLSMLVPHMSTCSRLLVHTIDDLNRMKSLGLVHNVSLFPHGVLDWKSSSVKQNSTFTLATYGFFLPHKGLPEIITMVKLLLSKGIQVKLKMVNAQYPVPESKEMIRQVTEQIKKDDLSEHIEMITDFLPDEDSLNHLTMSDLIVFPYQETGESSSASVRYGLATGVPVAVTPLKIFSDVGNAVYRLSGTTPEAMAESITEIIEGIQKHSDAAVEKQHNAKAWVKAHRYPMLGKRLYHMLTALHRKKTL